MLIWSTRGVGLLWPLVSSASRFAQFLTDVLAPAHLVAIIVLVIAWSDSGLLAGLAWGMLTLLFAPGLPYALILVGTRRGWWTDRHVRIREQRLLPLAFALVSVILCLTVLALADAPRAIGALVVAMTTGLVVTLAVTTGLEDLGACGGGGEVVRAAERVTCSSGVGRRGYPQRCAQRPSGQRRGGHWPGSALQGQNGGGPAMLSAGRERLPGRPVRISSRCQTFSLSLLRVSGSASFSAAVMRSGMPEVCGGDWKCL